MTVHIQIQSASSEDEMKKIVATASELLIDCGMTSLIRLQDKNIIVQALAMHHLILKCKAELDQLKNGLQTLGVAAAIRNCLNHSLL